MRQAYDYWQDQPGNYFPYYIKYSATRPFFNGSSFSLIKTHFDPWPSTQRFLNHRFKTALSPDPTFIQIHSLLFFYHHKNHGLHRELPMTSKIQLLGHGGFPTELTATSLAHWQVVHIPLFLMSTKCVQFPCVQSLNSPFQISVSCELQKCIFDSVQNKPALPLLLNAKAYFDIFNLYIYWYQVLLRPCPFRLDYPTPQISYKSLTRQDYSVTWALWHVQTVSPSHKTLAMSPHPQELPSCSLVERVAVFYNISQGTLLYSNPCSDNISY